MTKLMTNVEMTENVFMLFNGENFGGSLTPMSLHASQSYTINNSSNDNAILELLQNNKVDNIFCVK